MHIQVDDNEGEHSEKCYELAPTQSACLTARVSWRARVRDSECRLRRAHTEHPRSMCFPTCAPSYRSVPERPDEVSRKWRARWQLTCAKCMVPPPRQDAGDDAQVPFKSAIRLDCCHRMTSLISNRLRLVFTLLLFYHFIIYHRSTIGAIRPPETLISAH